MAEPGRSGSSKAETIEKANAILNERPQLFETSELKSRRWKDIYNSKPNNSDALGE